MHIPRRGPRRRTLLFAFAFFLISILVIATFTASQGQVLTPRSDRFDKRNIAPEGLGEIHGSNPSDDCWKHHAGEGMRDTVVIYPVIPRQIQIGTPVEIPVQIVNPWKQEVRKIELDVTLWGEPILVVEGAASSIAGDKFHNERRVVGSANTQDLPVGPGNPSNLASIPFEVPQGASGISASIELRPGRGANLGSAREGYDVKIFAESETIGNDFVPDENVTGDAAAESLNRHFAGLAFSNGTWRVNVTHFRGTALETEVFLNVTVVMGKTPGAAGARTYQLETLPTDVILKGGEPITYTFTVVPFAQGNQIMEFHVRAENYYEHQKVGTPNEDFYNRYANLTDSEDFVQGKSITPKRMVVVGTSFIASEFGPAVGEEPGEQWQLVLGEITGFAAAGLLLPSLLLGGTYGKASRRFFNTILGGAKRRVMFHNLSSLALSLVALIHLLLFVLEIRYTILMGVMWGGLGVLSLLVLGLTGYYQVPLIQRHGYKWWRLTHLAFGLLVVIFVGYHMIADGPDFFFLKERIPQWINEVNLAQK